MAMLSNVFSPLEHSTQWKSSPGTYDASTTVVRRDILNTRLNSKTQQFLWYKKQKYQVIELGTSPLNVGGVENM